MKPSIPTPLVLFDGDCAVCSTAVQFLLWMDRKEQLYFAPLESELGHSLKAQYGLESVDSLILIKNARASIRSTAVLEIASCLPWPWKTLYLLRCLPSVLLDLMYAGVAGIRKRGLLRRSHCRVPSPDRAHQFIN